MLSIAQRGNKVKWEVIERDTATGAERVLTTESRREVAERAVMLRRGILAGRGLMDKYELSIRKAGVNDDADRQGDREAARVDFGHDAQGAAEAGVHAAGAAGRGDGADQEAIAGQAGGPGAHDAVRAVEAGGRAAAGGNGRGGRCYLALPVDKGRLKEALRTRGLSFKKASVAIGRNEAMMSMAARRGYMSRTVGNSLAKMLGIKPEEYAPILETPPEPDHDSSILQTDTHTILNHILVMAAELCYREREGKL